MNVFDFTSRRALDVDVAQAGLKAVYVPQVPLTEGRMCDWIAGARVGQAIQYHEGHLCLDRARATSTLNARQRERLQCIARRAWIACELGLIHLMSLRVGEGHYRYLAVRTSSSLTPPQIRTQLRESTTTPSSPKLH